MTKKESFIGCPYCLIKDFYLLDNKEWRCKHCGFLISYRNPFELIIKIRYYKELCA